MFKECVSLQKVYSAKKSNKRKSRFMKLPDSIVKKFFGVLDHYPFQYKKNNENCSQIDIKYFYCRIVLFSEENEPK